MLTEGQILEDKYKVGRLLSKGGMGAVFIGENTRIKRVVAIKILHAGQDGTENAQRFEKEAQAAGQIGSDHIVEVLDLGNTPDGDRFMVMEFLDGETLKGRLARGRLSPAEIIPLLTQVLSGLTAAHAAGIVHRDLKPDNIFILKEKADRRDFVKIVDFGISKFNSLTGEGAQMTKTGAVMGTPYYMSPEQARSANEVDHRSDVYSVGVLLYEAVTGSVPFNGTTFTELIFKIVFEEPPHPQTLVPDLDPAFAELLLKAMARDPAERHQSAAELREALLAWQSGASVQTAPAAAPVATAPVATSKALNPAFAGTAVFRTAEAAAAQGQALPFQQSQQAPHAQEQPSAQQPQSMMQQPQHLQHPALGQSVSSGSQVLDAPGAAPKSRTNVVALVAVALLGLGGLAAFLVARSRGDGDHVAAATDPTARTASVSASPTASPSATAPASAQPTSAPSAAVTAEPTASAAPTPSQVHANPKSTASAKPSAAASAKPPARKGSLKDLGY